MVSQIRFGARCVIDSPELSAEQKEKLQKEILDRLTRVQAARIVGNMELSQDQFLLEDPDDPDSGAVTFMDRSQSFMLQALNQMKQQSDWLSLTLGIAEDKLKTVLDQAAVSVRYDQGAKDLSISGLGEWNKPVAKAIQAKANEIVRQDGPNYKGTISYVTHKATGDVYILNGDEGCLDRILGEAVPYINQVAEQHKIPLPLLLESMNRLYDRLLGIKKGSLNHFGPKPPEDDAPS